MNWKKRVVSVLAAASMAVGIGVVGATSASAASCGRVYVYSDNGIALEVVQSCSSLAKVKYTADCSWPQGTVSKTVTFPRGGASMITQMPACWNGTTGEVWYELLNP